jgi:hypothetical protein
MLWNGLWILRMPFWLSSSPGVKEINFVVSLPRLSVTVLIFPSVR